MQGNGAASWTARATVLQWIPAAAITASARSDIATLPQGASTPLNQVLLQAPGVAQDSYGQLHIRGDHGNVQYRINDIIVPESITGFGQSLDTRFADSINLLTGALPAQYGYRTAGVVDIHTKSGAFDNGGRIGVTVGSHNTRELSGEVSGHNGRLNYYLNASTAEKRSRHRESDRIDVTPCTTPPSKARASAICPICSATAHA